jgi:hypothetical protein
MKKALERSLPSLLWKRREKRRFFVILLASTLWLLPARTVGRQETTLQVPPDFEVVKKIVVPGNAAWTDTGLDVKKGQEFYFEATGTVSLQNDNPVASCGPEGLNLQTMQQPLPDQNLGTLIGKIREKVEVTEDKETGEKNQREIGELFFIGRENKVSLPSDGRLMLGVNENVVGDNDGGFTVNIYAKKRQEGVRS